MKKAVAFLLALLIFVAPITTLVKADVVIGDNDETILNENATILGRKLALMESLSDLALSGVTEFTISNTNDVDSYLDYLWEEVNDAIESLSDGTGFTEISNSLKSKYFTNLVQYKDYINNRGTYLANLLPTGNPTTSLLKTFFANNIYGKQYTQHYDLALDMFKSLSALNQGESSNLPVDFSFLNNTIDWLWDSTQQYAFASGLPFYSTQNNFFPETYIQDNWSFVSWYENGTDNNNFSNITVSPVNHIDLYIDDDGENITLRKVGGTELVWHTSDQQQYRMRYVSQLSGTGYLNVGSPWESISNPYAVRIDYRNSFDSLSVCANYIYRNFRHVNIYYNNDPWVIVDSQNTSPSLDIDGFLKIFDNDTPQQYELQPYTKIDYDQLYQVIYNAIRDNLPISQGDINYYDSHDTIYSPTIINNYGDEEGQESDLIDTILDYAVIPKFDTAIAQPMRQALNNGVVIMNNSITNVIPNEILLVLGACFFLLLFAVVINRMIK